jgi:hypothetical protein
MYYLRSSRRGAGQDRYRISLENGCQSRTLRTRPFSAWSRTFDDAPSRVSSPRRRNGAARVISLLRCASINCSMGCFSRATSEEKAQGFFKAVAHHLGRSGMELLFFDDALVNVEGARSAGWLAEQFTSVRRPTTPPATDRRWTWPPGRPLMGGRPSISARMADMVSISERGGAGHRSPTPHSVPPRAR